MSTADDVLMQQLSVVITNACCHVEKLVFMQCVVGAHAKHTNKSPIEIHCK